ncbi:MAG: hypothetical protein ACRYGP_17510 [Janthinobacterium lividum]
MHASTHALANHLANAAQALGFDAMSALAAELSARMAPAQAAAETTDDNWKAQANRCADRLAKAGVSFKVELDKGALNKWAEAAVARLDGSIRETVDKARAAGPTVTATISAKDFAEKGDHWFGKASLNAEPGEIRHLQPGDRLDFSASRRAAAKAAMSSYPVEPDDCTIHIQISTHPLFAAKLSREV